MIVGVVKLITKKQVEHVAKLARLSLNEEEKDKFSDQLGKILNYVDQLNELDTANVEPMTQAVPKINVIRKDTVCQSVDRDAILKNAPEEEDGYFKVPKITEE